MNIALIETALQAETMGAVIALTERYQTLESHPTGCIYTAYREFDQTLMLGYSQNIEITCQELSERCFVLLANRRGTRREQRLMLITLKEIGVNTSYSDNCFAAETSLLKHLRYLDWPLGKLQLQPRSKNTRKRFSRRS